MNQNILEAGSAVITRFGVRYVGKKAGILTAQKQLKMFEATTARPGHLIDLPLRAGLTIRGAPYQRKTGALFSYAKPGFSYLWRCLVVHFFRKKVDDLF